MNACHLLGLIGAVVVAAIGWRVAGLLGVVLGVPAGILVGVFGWIGTFLALGGVETRRDQLALRGSFGPYWRAEYRTGWEELKASLRPGAIVTGVVVRVRYHGAFLDLGKGFPGLIQAYHLVREGAELPSVGENVRAWVQEYDDDLRAVVLTMNERSFRVSSTFVVRRHEEGWRYVAVRLAAARSLT